LRANFTVVIVVAAVLVRGITARVIFAFRLVVRVGGFGRFVGAAVGAVVWCVSGDAAVCRVFRLVGPSWVAINGKLGRFLVGEVFSTVRRPVITIDRKCARHSVDAAVMILTSPLRWIDSTPGWRVFRDVLDDVFGHAPVLAGRIGAWHLTISSLRSSWIS
jgi:hypothetical protein